MFKKNALIDINWYKLGYQNYNYFKARKQICYSGKKILFSWNPIFFQDILFIIKGMFKND